MTSKQAIGSLFVGKTLHMSCDCIIAFDFVGVCQGYRIVGDEVLLEMNNNGKTISVGLNHPKLNIEFK